MIYYEVDILDIESGEVRRTPMHVGWTQYSPKVMREGMCDCNLGGYREMGSKSLEGNWTFCTQDHNLSAYSWRAYHGGCDHSIPPTRLKAVRAYLSDGRVWDYDKSEFQKAAA